ncbi:MAG: DUF21 domain-containing protein, partial [Nitrospira sp.]|nr:DUF21 domain-containing protein [Nitrospira sp.]
MEFAAILICLILSGFFSGAEIAFFSITESRLHAMVDEKSQAAQMALLLRRNPQRLLSTILIGNNVVNLTAAALVTNVDFRFIASKR